jgi:ATP-binding cassette subfamily B protein
VPELLSSPPDAPFEEPKKKLRLHRSLELRRAFALVWAASPRWTAVNFVLVFVQGLLPLLSLWLMKQLVDTVANGATAPLEAKQVALQHAYYLAGAAGGVALLTAWTGSLSSFVNEAQGRAVADYMNGTLQKKAVEVDLEYFENSAFFDTLHRAQTEAPYRPTRIVNGLSSLGQNMIGLIGIGAILFSLHPIVIFVLLGGALPGVFVRLRFINIMLAWQKRRSSLERRAGYFNWVLTLAHWAKEVRLFDLGDLFFQRHQILRADLRSEQLGISRRRAVSESAAQLFVVLPMFACMALVAAASVSGRLTVGALTMYFLAFQRGQAAVQGVMQAVLSLHEDSRFIGHLYEFLDLVPKISSPKNPRPMPIPMQKGVSFEEVFFSYPGSERAALQGLNLHIAPGEVVAIVGENGSGKTTLVKLLCRLYDPDGGCVAIDGVDVREMNVDDLRREISVIFQDYVQYDLSARENIRVGHSALPEGAPETDARIEEAARRSGAHDVIQKLPKGYETQLGREFEGGEELSIGQWQKVALARAFFAPLAGHRARRADQRAGPARRGRGVRQVPRAGRGPGGDLDLAPLVHGEDGRPHLRDAEWPRRRGRPAR